MTFPGRLNEGSSRLEGFRTAVLSFWNSKAASLVVWLTAREESVNSEGPLSKDYNPVALNGGEGKTGAERGTKSAVDQLILSHVFLITCSSTSRLNLRTPVDRQVHG